MKRLISSAVLAVMFLASCEKKDKECPGATERTFAIADFTKVKAGETFNVEIVQGNTFSIKASGCATDLNDLSVTKLNGGFIELKFKNQRNNRYRVDFRITMPALYSINLDGAAKGSVSGFSPLDNTTRAFLSGATELLINGGTRDVQFDISGTGKLSLKGATNTLKGMISGAGVLNAFEAPADDIDIAASGSGRANVHAVRAIIAEATGASHIVYRGDPATKDFSTSGAGKITKE